MEHGSRKVSWQRRGLVGAIVALVLPCASMAVAEEQAGSSDLSPQVRDALELLASHDPYQRQLGFLRLEAIRDPRSAEAIRGYVDSRDTDLRAYSLRALAAIEGAKAIPLLRQRLKTDRRPNVRRAALLGLEPLATQDPRLVDAFIDALADRSPEVRMAAVDVVSRLNEPRAKEAIRRLNKKEPIRDVRRVLKDAVQRVGGE